MTHTTLKVYVERFSGEPGGTLQVTSTKNGGSELHRHTFPAGVVLDFQTLFDCDAKVIRIQVLKDYVDRHGLAAKFE